MSRSTSTLLSWLFYTVGMVIRFGRNCLILILLLSIGCTSPQNNAVPQSAATPPLSKKTPTSSPIPSQTQPDSLLLMAFDTAADSGTWSIANDTVMGGVSTAEAVVENSILTFNGNLSFENNGGFTSIRYDLATDLSNFTGIQMRVRGDGRDYFLRFSDKSDRREASHESPFSTTAGEWTTVTIPFEQLVPSFRGIAVDRSPLELANLRAMGIILREKNPGAFQLEIDWIQAYR